MTTRVTLASRSQRRLHSVGEAARIAKVTIRTLHHYDRIGLLVPSERTAAGYRQYSRSDLERLFQIRLHRDLGLPLEEIRSILDAEDFDTRRALREHRRRLLERIDETRSLVATLDRLLADEEKGDDMPTEEELFDGFQPEEHAAEAEARWGDTSAWKEAQRRTRSYGPEQWREIKAESDSIFAEMAELMASGESAGSQRAQAIAERHRLHIDRWFYNCSRTMHRGLASMYTSDPRFAAAFERHGEGLADYFRRAIEANRD